MNRFHIVQPIKFSNSPYTNTNDTHIDDINLYVNEISGELAGGAS